MSKIKNVEIYGLNESMIASGYPMRTESINMVEELHNLKNSEFNNKTIKRAKNLSSCDSSEGHDNFLIGIVVQFDLTLSLKAWPEAQRYHFLDFVSSRSTMHKIMKMDIKKCCNIYVTNKAIENLNEQIENYNKWQNDKTKECNPTRWKKVNEELFFYVIYNIPTGLELEARMTTNYRQLKTIYKQRRNHRLVHDWGVVCDWIETLPYFNELIKPSK